MSLRRSRTRAALPTTDQTLLDKVNAIRDLTERIDVVEHDFRSLGMVTVGDQDQASDVMDLRLQVARLSAELSRVTVELNARIAEVAHSTGVALSDEAVAPIPTPDLAGDESFTDLTADSPARVRTGSDPTPGADSSQRTSGWQPID